MRETLTRTIMLKLFIVLSFAVVAFGLETCEEVYADNVGFLRLGSYSESKFLCVHK